jgi:hypothetical protein
MFAWMGAASIAAFISEGGEAMQGSQNIKILFIAGFGPIVRETAKSRKLYSELLGIPFKEENDGYLHTEAMKGAKNFCPVAAFSGGAIMFWQRFLA